MTTSTRSTNSGAMFWIAAVPIVPGLMRRPSIRTSTWFDSVPRRNSEVCWPAPPRRATSTPGTKRSASPRSAAGWRISSLGLNDVDAREHFPGGIFGARRGDDDGFEGLAAGGSGKKDNQRSSVLLPSGDSKVHRSRRRNEGRARTPAPPVARRDWRLLTGRSPDSRRVPRDLSASPSHRDIRQWLQAGLRDAACAVYRCGGSAGMASDSRTGFPISPGSRPGHLSSRAILGRRIGAVKPPLTKRRAPRSLAAWRTRQGSTQRSRPHPPRRI